MVVLPTVEEVHLATQVVPTGRGCGGITISACRTIGQQVGDELEVGGSQPCTHVVVVAFAHALPIEADGIAAGGIDTDGTVGIADSGLAVGVAVAYTVVVGDIECVGAVDAGGGAGNPSVASIDEEPAGILAGLEAGGIRQHGRNGTGGEGNLSSQTQAAAAVGSHTDGVLGHRHKVGEGVGGVDDRNLAAVHKDGVAVGDSIPADGGAVLSDIDKGQAGNVSTSRQYLKGEVVKVHGTVGRECHDSHIGIGAVGVGQRDGVLGVLRGIDGDGLHRSESAHVGRVAHGTHLERVGVAVPALPLSPEADAVSVHRVGLYVECGQDESHDSVDGVATITIVIELECIGAIVTTRILADIGIIDVIAGA